MDGSDLLERIAHQLERAGDAVEGLGHLAGRTQFMGLLSLLAGWVSTNTEVFVAFTGDELLPEPSAEPSPQQLYPDPHRPVRGCSVTAARALRLPSEDLWFGLDVRRMGYARLPGRHASDIIATCCAQQHPRPTWILSSDARHHQLAAATVHVLPPELTLRLPAAHPGSPPTTPAAPLNRALALPRWPTGAPSRVPPAWGCSEASDPAADRQRHRHRTRRRDGA